VNAERTDLASRLTDEERADQERLEAEIVRLNRELLNGKSDAKAAGTLRSELSAARARWEQNESTLYARAGVRRAPKITDPLQSPSALIPTADDVILNFVVGEKQTTLFVLSREDEEVRIETHTIAAGTANLQRDVDRFLGRLASLNFDYEGDARSLYRLLIAPAENTLRGKSVIAIVADGPLWRLPFQVLAGSDGKPLVTRFAMFSAPSLMSLSRVSRSPDGHRPFTVLAIGNPRVGGDTAATVRAQMRADLGDLPDAAVEARQVAALYDRDRSHVLIGTQATERAVKERAAEYDILHLAAHAVTDDSQPLYSSIVLAREDDREDGLLEGREITRLDLRARLTVLSACSTAQGRVRPGEGLIGLSWAFLVAGCPTIVATQWRVPSASTALLMVDFHRELARGDISVAEALQRAQMRLMKDRRYRHPFYWSGFVVVGAGRS
jgi:CHAT domain-containing protein